jgi:long-chain fatty acid transport protein
VLRTTFAIGLGLTLGLLAGARPLLAANTAVEGVATRARALGNAFTAIADDASAVYYNPAGLVQVEGDQVLLDLVAVQPRLSYDADSGGGADSTRGARAPSLFFASDHFKGVTLGLGVFAPFARDAAYHGLGARHRASLLRTDFAPTAAFELGQNWAVGFGATASRIGLHSDILGFEENARGYGFTGQFGVLYRGFDRLQLGLSYRGPMNAHIEGRGTLAGVAHDQHSSRLRFPDVLSAGAAWRPGERWTLSASADFERWSYFDEVRREYSNPVLRAIGRTVVDAQDALNLRVGVSYQPAPGTELRAGFGYLPRAVPLERTVPAQPDYRTQIFSLGVSHQLGRATFDLGYSYARSRGEHSAQALFPGDYRVSAHLLSFGVTIPIGAPR